jgi:hypothetical protein
MDVEDELRLGRQVTEKPQDNIDWIRNLIEEDLHSTYADLEAETSFSYVTIFTIIHECLQMKKVSLHWVPHPEEGKMSQVTSWKSNPARQRLVAVR